MLLAVGTEHLVLTDLAQRHQDRRAHCDLVGLQIFDDRFVVRGRDRDADLNEVRRILEVRRELLFNRIVIGRVFVAALALGRWLAVVFLGSLFAAAMAALPDISESVGVLENLAS